MGKLDHKLIDKAVVSDRAGDGGDLRVRRHSWDEVMIVKVCQLLATDSASHDPGVAARIAHKKTGVVTSLDKSTADHLASLLNHVLTNPTYRENARTLQKAIAEANGLSFAADLIEESLGMSRKISAAAA